MQEKDAIVEAASFIRHKLDLGREKSIGVILGTGLGQWAATLPGAASIPCSTIPHFSCSTVQGHSGRLWVSKSHSRRILALQGRVHLYEGYTPARVCFGVRVLRELGADGLILTNAAGALNPLFNAGELMLITDHINFTGHNPLTGPNDESFGPRFPDLSRVYSKRLRDLALDQARALGVVLEKGVYIGVSGPSLETPAETRAFRSWGADAVGMSTIMEAIAARHLSMEVLGISCLTNKNLPDCMEETSLEQVLAQARASSHKLEKLLTAVIENWPES